MEDFFNKEWLVTNGLGGYASGAVNGANTRQYHGLLVAALEPPTDRMVVVAKIEERVLLDGQYHNLSSNQYPKVVFPESGHYLKSFDVNPTPSWQFAGNNWDLYKNIKMIPGSNTTVVTYTNNGIAPLVLELHPLYAYNDFHTTFHEASSYNFFTEFNEGHLKTFPKYGSQPVFTGWTSGQFFEDRSWFKNIILPKGKSRGLGSLCDYYRIGYLVHELQPGEDLTLYFTVEDDIIKNGLKNLPALGNEKQKSRNKKLQTGFFKDLMASGEQFLVQRKSTNSMSIIAGYHWFTDWGRDTMIAMRGLTIATGNQALSNSILNTFFKSVDQGMIPDRFPDNAKDPVHYNTIDATLWLFVASYDYHQKFKDLQFLKSHISILKDILDQHISGARYNIHITEEGFIYGGEPNVQLTWMDAIVGGKVITPRIGCPVEINALWYNALKIYENFCSVLKVEIDACYLSLVTRFETNFTKYFTNPQGTLYDVIVPGISQDNTFRPNQIYCLSLPFTVFNIDQQKSIFEAVKHRLYTPFGLRTLDQDNPDYKPNYEGNQWSRDHAYHQGTVWPFLLYEYFQSFFNIYGTTLENKKKVLSELEPLKEHFYFYNGIHCISEVFNGDDPKEGKGCIHQAWSVAAIIKLYVDYGLDKIENKSESEVSVKLG
ncbi:amylo-alpha-1,6-glucosidase [Arenibacter sp. F26102]|uniref:amylo-alpha-1,6-glucosidase n=1 Tax=Arenibacter sp. F26102 TaxID=2926416 RepID=UPI001FF59281|nr:amylo-alpha-1,6-glucosidase [Arenibacter sp. F26102]MCK0146610.1 amylo-alpha-1,6-glucosidase [Arenibacter sp. F26102]